MSEFKPFDQTYQQRFEEAEAIYKDITGVTLTQTTPERYIIMFMIAAFQQNGINFNIEYQRFFLQWMAGAQLDAYGDMWRSPRLDSVASIAPVLVTFTSSLSATQIIYENTILNGSNENGSFTFKTLHNYYCDASTTTIEIEASEYYVDGDGETVNSGSDANGCTISGLEDTTLYSFIDTAQTDSALSSGGSDSEEDDEYKDRLKYAPAKQSTAGARPSYQYLTRAIDPTIIDADVTKTGFTVNLWILPKEYDGVPANYADLVAKVNLVYNPTTGNSAVRPVCDAVSVACATVKNYKILSVDITVYDEKNIKSIEAKSLTAIEQFEKSLLNRLGQDVVESQLVRALQIDGVKQVTVEFDSTTVGLLVVSSSEVAVPSVYFSSSDLTVSGAAGI